MKTIILAGGLGTRLAEKTEDKPKPMVEIGGMPILWHIMKIYSHYGINEFIICLGYRGYYIKEYFSNYFLHRSDITIDLKNNSMEIHNNTSEPWKVTLIDTGLYTSTGARIKKVRNFIDGTFMLTYGDGIADITLDKLLKFHKKHGKIVSMTSAQPEGRFGALNIEADNRISNFFEKPKGGGGWVNAGFFVCEPEVFNYIDDSPDTVFEKEPLETLAKESQLFTYKHSGFWKCMDTLRDKNQLEQMWHDNPQWKVWE